MASVLLQEMSGGFQEGSKTSEWAGALRSPCGEVDVGSYPRGGLSHRWSKLRECPTAVNGADAVLALDGARSNSQLRILSSEHQCLPDIQAEAEGKVERR
jgi:hypothetical protein